MKTTTLIRVSVLILAIALTSCSDDNKDNSSIGMPAQTKMSVQTDAAVDDLYSIIESEYSEQNPNGRTAMDGPVVSLLPSCATVTTTTSGSTWHRTIDFGTTGCALYNGNVIKGIIEISGFTDFSAMSQTINYSLENFYHNNIRIDGSKFATRVLQNANGNPQSTIQLELGLTFPDGTHAIRTGSRVWEWVAGVNTPFNPADNEFLVTGTWTTAFPQNTLTTTVTTPLRVKMSCQNIVEGVLNFETANNAAVLDYGSGNCDDTAALSINGGTAIIFLLN